MAYCIVKSIEIQRSKALKEIFLEDRSIAQVARRFGRNRSAIYRWIKRQKENNNYPDFRNYGRPNRAPGELVEADTVFLMNHFGGQNLYITNVIDVYTRMTHSRVDYAYSQTSTADTVLEAQELFGFKFKMVQCDNGREFGERFKLILNKNNIQIRHTRVRRPNDNAHIERFNRTMRDELIGPYTGRGLEEISKSIREYLIYYNYTRIHTTLRMTPIQMLQSCWPL